MMIFSRKPEAEHGATRTVKKFLWWPLTINDETRWLETAEIEQEYYYNLVHRGWLTLGWKDKRR